jgi:serine/threonine protein kinase
MERHSETMKAPLLHQNLTLKRRGQDPMLSYSLVAILGEGSMGSVSKVLKRDNVGSARSGFLQKHSANILAKFNQCWRSCCDDNNDDDTRKFNPRDLISSMSSHDSLLEDGVSPKSDLSAMIRFGHQDTFFALKSIHLSMARDQTLREELKNEVEILKTLDHPVSSGFFCPLEVIGSLL